MRIGILTSYFYPVVGGAENVILNQAKELAKNNEVHVFTTNKKGDEIFQSEEIYENIHIHRVPVWFRYKYYLAFYPRIISKLLKYDLDILHVNSMGFLQHDLAVLIKKLKDKNIKLICTPHGIPMALGNYSFAEKILKKLYLPIARFINKYYNYFIQVNPCSYKIFKEYGVPKDRLKLIPNGVDKNIFLPAEKNLKDNLIKKYNLKGKTGITYLGRIQEYKGLDQIIKSLPKNKNVVFVAIGEDAGDKGRLKKLAKELDLEKQAIFTGKVNEKEKSALLDISEIFIFPSRDEMFGIAMLEAMAKENAIISTKTFGGKYLIKKENGFLYDFEDVKDLRKKLNILIKNKKLRKEMQENNLKKAKNFTWEKINKKLIKLYKEVLNEK